MSLTKQRSNIPGASRGINLSDWAPLVTRLTKMAVQYAQSSKNSQLGQNSVGGFALSGQRPSGGGTGGRRTRSRQPRRGNAGQFSDTSGIPRNPILKVQQVTVHGSHVVQLVNGSVTRKWHVGNATDLGADLLVNSTSNADIAFLKAFSCWKIHRVILTFTSCLAATDGGYHVGVTTNTVDFIAPVDATPSVIRSKPGAKMQSIQQPMILTLSPTHNEGVVHYGEANNSDDVTEKEVGTILYYIAGGVSTSNQPAAILTYSMSISVWS